VKFSFRVQIRRAVGFALDVDLSGEADGLGIVGPSGSGKTTLLNAIAGLEPAERIELDGARLDALPAHERGLGYVGQDALLFPHLTVRENLRFSPRAGPIEPVVEALSLANLLDRKPGTLSGGERRRVAVARALASRPRALLLDEPFSGLDEMRRREAMSLLAHVRAQFGLPMILVSHVPEEVVGLAGKMLRIEEGRAVSLTPSLEALRPGETRLDNYWTALVVGPGRARVGRTNLSVSLPEGVSGAIRLGVYATDAILARSAARGVSSRNALSCRVESVWRVGDACLVRVLEPSLLVSVTREAARELQVRPGKAIRVLLKSTAIAYLGPA